MKPKTKLLMLAIGVVAALFIAAGCADHRKSASTYLRTPVPADATVVTCVEDESWFWCVLQLTPKQSAAFDNAVTKTTHWRPMPIPSELMAAGDFLQPHTSEFTGHIPVANTNGFFTFLDLEAEYAAKHPDPGSPARMKVPFHKRGGLNFVFGYFDDIAGKIYVWWFHT